MGEETMQFKIGSFYFQRNHLRRIILLVVCAVLIVYWFAWHFQSYRPSHARPKPGLILPDFEPLQLPHRFHYNLSQDSSLKFSKRRFMLDGKPLIILSGSMHYFRIPVDYWKDRLLKLKACGLNTVETYVPWNKHEEIKGHVTFENNLDLRRFIKLAKSIGLYVILRPGPYICAEWDLGGLPSWLLHDPKMKLRSNYPPYMQAVSGYFKRLLPKVVDLQYSRGGPIFMVQVENEFGSFSDDGKHLQFITQTLRENGIHELLVISESMAGIFQAPLPQALITVNFQKIDEGKLLLDAVRRSDPEVPLMVMEFWTGWFDHWGAEHNVVGTERIKESLQYILTMQSSINLYMFHGGTNFGFTSGANQFTDYKPDITSYDYGAPLSEAGDLTIKYMAIRNMLIDFVLKPQGISKLPEPPPNTMKAAYGSVDMEFCLSWQNLLKTVQPIKSKEVMPMEMLDINNGGGQASGYIVYRHSLKKSGRLRFGAARDRAQVLLNGIQVALVDWHNKTNSVHLPDMSPPIEMDILVENLGRVNYFTFNSNIINEQRKGLAGEVLLSNSPLLDWQIFPLEFKESMLNSIEESEDWQPMVHNSGMPCMFKGRFEIVGTPKDTFLSMKGWTKGVAFINGFNLGRYWNIGPQSMLYVPAPILRSGLNKVLIFEEVNPSGSVLFLNSYKLSS